MSKTINKKILIVISAILVCAMAMAGCSSKDSGSGSGDDASDKISVTLSINCETLADVDADLMDKVSDNGVILADKEIEIEAGKSALDVLRASGTDFSETGGMISEINGLGSGQAGEMSGWLFKVNDEFPPLGAGDLEMSDGDHLTFVYSTNGGEDIGLTFE